MGHISFNSRPDSAADISLINTGEEDCRGGHQWGGLRTAYLLHYVFRGRGVFECRGRRYPLGPGQAFLITPGERQVYTADMKDPWHYAWADFTGHRVADTLAWAGLSAETPIFSHPFRAEFVTLFRDMHRVLKDHEPQGPLLADALLHRLLATLVALNPHPPRAKPGGRATHYVARTLDFIRDNYSRELTISSLADLVGIHRSHLAEVFLKETGKSVRDTLLEYRVNRAKELLTNTNLPITEISNSVGYPIYTAFSIRFKALCGMTPGEYRKKGRFELGQHP